MVLLLLLLLLVVGPVGPNDRGGRRSRGGTTGRAGLGAPERVPVSGSGGLLLLCLLLTLLGGCQL